MRFFAVALTFFWVTASYAQAPEVPHKMHFANMTLAIRDDARREIQQDVDALTRHERYFRMKVERAKTYFPIITKIFEEEGLPDDFKYLVLQESALVPDAVSVSNAVGFWQFKDFTAVSMGLRVDNIIDERMNIASATRGAAGYLKQNYAQFDNWLLALQAYQMGAGGLRRTVGDKYNGKRHMEITTETYWYVKKFIAHKVAFENAIVGEPQLKVYTFESKQSRSMADLANDLQMDESVLKEYNKWALRGNIPDDKPYIIIIPTTQPLQDLGSLTLSSDKSSRAKPLLIKPGTSPDIRFINGLRTIKAVPGESMVSLTERAGISLAKFLRFNEISIDQPLEAGTYYFLEKKQSKAEALQHRVKPGEDLWKISQSYGIRVSKLEKWNRRSRFEKLAINSFIKLNPKTKIEMGTTQQPQPLRAMADPILGKSQSLHIEESKSSSNDAFDWEIKTGEPSTLVSVAAKTDSVRQVPTGQSTTYFSSQVKEHIVKAGETLYSISKLYGITVSDLLKWNEITTNNVLSTGQKIYLSERVGNPNTQAVAPLNVEKQAQTHEVKADDTLYSIARQYGITIKDLMDWNKKKDLTIKLGEVLWVTKR
ncbi:MAG: LysM peptidoglycan-binding domain-containing protein [Flammeovirgaceae bacterium]